MHTCISRLSDIEGLLCTRITHAMLEKMVNDFETKLIKTFDLTNTRRLLSNMNDRVLKNTEGV